MRYEQELLKLLTSTPGPGPWVTDANCRDEDPAVFDTPDPNTHPRLELARQRRAGDICADCPVLKQCADYQAASGAVGVWGGVMHSGNPARQPINLISRTATERLREQRRLERRAREQRPAA